MLKQILLTILSLAVIISQDIELPENIFTRPQYERWENAQQLVMQDVNAHNCINIPSPRNATECNDIMQSDIGKCCFIKLNRTNEEMCMPVANSINMMWHIAVSTYGQGSLIECVASSIQLSHFMVMILLLILN
jgi:hypothetical protein